MTQARVSRIAAVLPLLCSALAFAVVMANILSGVRPEPDENASAHLWQLLMIAQLPLILLFAATADWRTGVCHRPATCRDGPGVPAGVAGRLLSLTQT
jgi:hypothetical protein